MKSKLGYDVNIAINCRKKWFSDIGWDEFNKDQLIGFRDSREIAILDCMMPDLPLQVEVLGFDWKNKTLTRHEWKSAYRMHRNYIRMCNEDWDNTPEGKNEYGRNSLG